MPLVVGLGGGGWGKNEVEYIMRIKIILLHTKVKQISHLHFLFVPVSSPCCDLPGGGPGATRTGSRTPSQVSGDYYLGLFTGGLTQGWGAVTTTGQQGAPPLPRASDRDPELFFFFFYLHTVIYLISSIFKYRCFQMLHIKHTTIFFVTDDKKRCAFVHTLPPPPNFMEMVSPCPRICLWVLSLCCQHNCLAVALISS